MCAPIRPLIPPSGNAMADPLGVFGRLDSTVVDKKNSKETFSGAIGGLRPADSWSYSCSTTGRQRAITASSRAGS